MKLKAQDGKYRLTDVVDIEGIFRLNQFQVEMPNYECTSEKEIEMK